jgi:NAD-dependent deacetylase
MLEPGQRIFVLTGAGISAESGVRTFRDADGLWYEYRVEDVATPEAFERDPRLVWRFYSERRRQLETVRPNAAHFALAELAKRSPELFLCTQNVDPLHELAGSPHVLHMHGEIARTRCTRCDRAPFPDTTAYFDELPRCDCGALLRPHVVWFGEMPFALDEISEALNRCDTFLCVGSSGAVYPAAGFVAHLRRCSDARLVYVGLETPDNARFFDEIHLGKAGESLPRLLGIPC